jgi:hypothetical protein
MQKLITCLLLAGLAQGARAQEVSFGARLGGNLATATFNSLDALAGSGIAIDYTKSPIVAPQLGLAVNMQWGNWAFQPALLFSQKGLKQSVTANIDNSGYSFREEINTTSRINYLELPLNVVYTTGGDNGFQVFAGPYVAVGVGGKATYSESVTSSGPNGVTDEYSDSGSAGYTFANEFADPNSAGGNSTGIFATARRFDAGITGGVGYRVGPIQAQLGYSLGLVNAQPDYPASYQTANETGYHRSLQLTATYFFAGK